MIIGSTIINRESYINCRVPESLKLQFYALAKSKGKSAQQLHSGTDPTGI